jgi:hypothetical protein
MASIIFCFWDRQGAQVLAASVLFAVMPLAGPEIEQISHGRLSSA